MEEWAPDPPYGMVFDTAPATRAAVQAVHEGVSRQAEALVELVRTLRSQNEQFAKLVEVVQQVVELQREINRDVVEIRARWPLSNR